MESLPSLLALHKKVHDGVCVQSVLWLRAQSVLWLHAPMDEWLDSLSVSQTTRVQIPLNVLFFSPLFLFLSLFIGLGGHMHSDVGPDVKNIK